MINIIDHQISKKLKIIFLISIIIFIAHGIEGALTGFHKVDWYFKLIVSYLEPLGLPLAVGWTFQVMLWLLLAVSFLLLLDKKWILYLMVIWGLIFIVELHHPYKAIIAGTYYPGTITALLFFIIGIFFWRELLKEFSNKK